MSEFEHEVNKFHQLLAFHKVVQNDVVTIISGNSSAMVVALLGTMTYGATIMPLNPALKPDEVEALLLHSTPKLLLSDTYQPKAGQFQMALTGLNDYQGFEGRQNSSRGHHQGGILIYTSGTTGDPKGVLLSEEQVLYNLSETQLVIRKNQQHVAACFLPLFHLFGVMSDLIMTLVYGGKVVVLPSFEISSVPLIVASIDRYKVNTFSAVPLMFDLLVKLGAKITPGQLQFCISGGGPLREEVRMAFDQKFNTNIVPAYGVTECACFCLCSDPNDIVPKSAGSPVAMEVLVVNENGKELAAGETGEIVIKGPTVIAEGYFRDNRDCYLSINNENWFRTGDLGYYDEKGRFYISGRLKNMIIKGGAKIYLEDVDQFIQRIPGIADVTSMKLRQDLKLEIEKFVSYVVLDKSYDQALTEQEIKLKIKEGLGHQKIPNQIVFLDKIDRSPTGKMKIQELQQSTV